MGTAQRAMWGEGQLVRPGVSWCLQDADAICSAPLYGKMSNKIATLPIIISPSNSECNDEMMATIPRRRKNQNFSSSVAPLQFFHLLFTFFPFSTYFKHQPPPKTFHNTPRVAAHSHQQPHRYARSVNLSWPCCPTHRPSVTSSGPFFFSH